MIYPAKSIFSHLLDKRRKINVFIDEIATVRHAKSIASQPLALGHDIAATTGQRNFLRMARIKDLVWSGTAAKIGR